MGEVFAAMLVENFFSLPGNLFKGLKAIGYKTRVEDGNILDALLCQCLNRLVGIGLPPLLGTKA